MTVDILTEAIIERPRAVVAAFAGDPSNAPRWYINIRSVEWEGEPRVALGAKAAFVARFLRRAIPDGDDLHLG